MKIHHLNCISLNSPLLVETHLGPALVDLTIGRQDYLRPSPKMRFFLSYMNVPKITCQANRRKPRGATARIAGALQH